jgi:hypothetical protein
VRDRRISLIYYITDAGTFFRTISRENFVFFPVYDVHDHVCPKCPVYSEYQAAIDTKLAEIG